MRGLKASDFAVFEDGQRQKITVFQGAAGEGDGANVKSPVNVDGIRSSTQRGPLASNSGSPIRTYLICVDTLNTSITNFAGIRKALTNFMERERDREAQYILIALGRDMQVLTDSTRDPQAVIAALQSKKLAALVQNSEASNIAFDTERMRRLLETGSGTGCLKTPDNCEGVKRQVRSMVTASAERTFALTRGFLSGLKSAIDTIAQMPTDKTLLLMSEGFNLIPGRELSGVASAHLLDRSEWLSNQRNLQTYLDDLIKTAQRANVVVNSLNSRGVYSLASGGSLYDAASAGQGNMKMGEAQSKMDVAESTILWDNESAIAPLSEATGGYYFHNNNDLQAGLRRAFDDGRERYVLAYSPTRPEPDNKFRKIRV